MSLKTFFDSFALLSDTPNGLAKLRELILQLAIEGKLSTHNSNDESGLALLERIKTLRARLAKDHQIKPITPTTISEQEKFCATPSGWTWARLQEIGQIVGGGTPRSDNSEYFSANDIAWLTPADLYGYKEKYIAKGRRGISKLGLMRSSAQLMPAGTVLFSSRAPIGYVAIAANDLATNQGFKSCVAYEREMSEFIYYFLRARRKKLEAVASGTTFKEIPGKQFSQIVIPIPPLEEQKRIVDRIDELMQLCDELEAQQQAKRESRVRLNSAILAPLNQVASLTPEDFEQASTRLAVNFDTLYDSIDTVSKLRATILQLAVQGKLVPQNPNDEAADSLVRRIKIDRETTAKNKKIKLKEIPIAESPLSDLAMPPSWQREALGNLVEAERSISYGVLVPGYDTANGIPFVRLQDLDIYNPPAKPSKSIAPEIEKQYARTRLMGGEILLGVVGSIGKLGVAPHEWAGANIARAVSRIAPHNLVNRDYLVIALRSPAVQRYFLEATRTLAQPTLNVSLIELTQVPLPPLAEQKRIVAKVNQLMSLCDELEAKLRQAEADSEKLMNAAVKHVLDSVRNASQPAEEVFA